MTDETAPDFQNTSKYPQQTASLEDLLNNANIDFSVDKKDGGRKKPLRNRLHMPGRKKANQPDWNEKFKNRKIENTSNMTQSEILQRKASEERVAAKIKEMKANKNRKRRWRFNCFGPTATYDGYEAIGSADESVNSEDDPLHTGTLKLKKAQKCVPKKVERFLKERNRKLRKIEWNESLFPRTTKITENPIVIYRDNLDEKERFDELVNSTLSHFGIDYQSELQKALNGDRVPGLGNHLPQVRYLAKQYENFFNKSKLIDTPQTFAELSPFLTKESPTFADIYDEVTADNREDFASVPNLYNQQPLVSKSEAELHTEGVEPVYEPKSKADIAEKASKYRLTGERTTDDILKVGYTMYVKSFRNKTDPVTQLVKKKWDDEPADEREDESEVLPVEGSGIADYASYNGFTTPKPDANDSRTESPGKKTSQSKYSNRKQTFDEPKGNAKFAKRSTESRELSDTYEETDEDRLGSKANGDEAIPEEESDKFTQNDDQRRPTNDKPRSRTSVQPVKGNNVNGSAPGKSATNNRQPSAPTLNKFSNESEEIAKILDDPSPSATKKKSAKYKGRGQVDTGAEDDDSNVAVEVVPYEPKRSRRRFGFPRRKNKSARKGSKNKKLSKSGSRKNSAKRKRSRNPLSKKRSKSELEGPIYDAGTDEEGLNAHRYKKWWSNKHFHMPNPFGTDADNNKSTETGKSKVKKSDVKPSKSKNLMEPGDKILTPSQTDAKDPYKMSSKNGNGSKPRSRRPFSRSKKNKGKNDINTELDPDMVEADPESENLAEGKRNKSKLRKPFSRSKKDKNGKEIPSDAETENEPVEGGKKSKSRLKKPFSRSKLRKNKNKPNPAGSDSALGNGNNTLDSPSSASDPSDPNRDKLEPGAAKKPGRFKRFKGSKTPNTSDPDSSDKASKKPSKLGRLKPSRSKKDDNATDGQSSGESDNGSKKRFPFRNNKKAKSKPDPIQEGEDAAKNVTISQPGDTPQTTGDSQSKNQPDRGQASSEGNAKKPNQPQFPKSDKTPGNSAEPTEDGDPTDTKPSRLQKLNPARFRSKKSKPDVSEAEPETSNEAENEAGSNSVDPKKPSRLNRVFPSLSKNKNKSDSNESTKNSQEANKKFPPRLDQNPIKQNPRSSNPLKGKPTGATKQSNQPSYNRDTMESAPQGDAANFQPKSDNKKPSKVNRPSQDTSVVPVTDPNANAMSRLLSIIPSLTRNTLAPNTTVSNDPNSPNPQSQSTTLRNAFILIGLLSVLNGICCCSTEESSDENIQLAWALAAIQVALLSAIIARNLRLS